MTAALQQTDSAPIELDRQRSDRQRCDSVKIDSAAIAALGVRSDEPATASV